MTRVSHRVSRVAAAAGLLLALLPVRASADDPAARELMRAVFDQAKVSFEAKMKLSSPGGLLRELDIHHKQMPQVSATYMEVTAPNNLKGTRFLSWDREVGTDEHYTYLPMVKRSVQVPEWTLKQSFLGSNFYMVDIAIPDQEQFDYAFAGDSDVDGKACKLAASTPRHPEDEPYSKVVYCVDVDKKVSIRTEYYDVAATLLKVWKADRLEKVEGIWTPLSQSMTDVQQNTESRLDIVEIHMYADPPDEMFRKAHLDR